MLKEKMIQYFTVWCGIAIYSFKNSRKLRNLNSEYYSWLYHSQSADRANIGRVWSRELWTADVEN